MITDDIVLSFVRRIVDTNERSPASRAALAMELAMKCYQLPTNVAEALNLLLESPEWEAVDRGRRAVGEARLWEIGADQFVNLVADLARRRIVTDATAVEVLAGCPHDTRDNLPEELKHLVEVAEAVEEDAREGFLDIDDDSGFRRAIFSSTRLRSL